MPLSAEKIVEVLFELCCQCAICSDPCHEFREVINDRASQQMWIDAVFGDGERSIRRVRLCLGFEVGRTFVVVNPKPTLRVADVVQTIPNSISELTNGLDVRIRRFFPFGSRRIGDLVLVTSVRGSERGINITEAEVEILTGCAALLGVRIEGLSDHLEACEGHRDHPIRGVLPDRRLWCRIDLAKHCDHDAKRPNVNTALKQVELLRLRPGRSQALPQVHRCEDNFPSIEVDVLARSVCHGTSPE